MSGSSFVSPVQTTYGSGRMYMDLNRWRSFNGAYGPGYHQVSSSNGTGANPAPSANNRNGYIISRSQLLSEVRIRLRRNSSEAVTFEYDFFVMRSGVYTQIIRISDITPATAFEQFSAVVNFQLLRDDILMLAGRKANGSTTRRYAYASWSFDVL